jgi:hypothetical protein
MRASNMCRPALLLLVTLLTNARFRNGEREVELSLDRHTGSHGAWLSRWMQILCIGLELLQRLISLLRPVESAGEDDEP